MLGGCARLGPTRMTHTPGLRGVRLDSQGPGSDAVRQVSFLVPGPLPCPLPGSISFFFPDKSSSQTPAGIDRETSHHVIVDFKIGKPISRQTCSKQKG